MVSQWDLCIVLKALSSSPFFSSSAISLWNLTLKMVFLLAIPYAKRVSELHALSVGDQYCTFFPDWAVLRPNSQFLPNVTSAFHFNQEIVLPVLLEDSGGPHPSDVVHALQRYVLVTQDFRTVSNLFVLPRGSRKGQAASARTLALWLVKII